MEITVKCLKEELMQTIHKIDKTKLTIADLKVLAEAISTLATIHENEINFETMLASLQQAYQGYKPATVGDLKGDDCNGG